jgi:hypothetical protein
MTDIDSADSIEEVPVCYQQMNLADSYSFEED